ncbi:3,5-dihydroxyphenylacetyl-CoA synthase DpgA [Streptomyces sp. CB01881]|uniref:3,5-dihydroxyphenylacetyl-CoA synthase DpgA n=1 Tax=Streptomyces sp. CB01881 TaxID=2078691 RepID=UPI000CDC704F|nr:3,5-dihydroxyphenylacetyl-CoA synthase DpgA [Streptomyces sp. CB01881]AUY49206.1 type III polyketide synthase [Streptomyces sp. CB01881]TYC77699.1 type III polyketide synthase [Streptomyces sp. CB01881]
MKLSERPSQYAPPGSAGAGGNSRIFPRVFGVGTAVPATSYTQEEILEEFKVTDPRIRSIFRNSAIERRGLTLPPLLPDGSRAVETQGQLLQKHVTTGLAMGREAVEACLKAAGAELSDVRYLCCVTTTGLLTPGFSALLIKELGIDRHCSRLDVVGMGCNAGLNALTAVAGWANAHPGELALMVCMEACSAAYVFDGTMRTSVVNSLFGDGSAALAVLAPEGGAAAEVRERTAGPSLLRFSSCIIPEAVDAMRYDWDDDHGKYSFYLDPEVPYVVGAHAEIALGRLLAGTGLRRSDISHWTVHSGGKKVIDSVRANLGLSRYDVRHTTGVLRDHGNLSSGSFLFSYERLMAEDSVRPGDYGVFMTMGPGSTIEMALVRW